MGADVEAASLEKAVFFIRTNADMDLFTASLTFYAGFLPFKEIHVSALLAGVLKGVCFPDFIFHGLADTCRSGQSNAPAFSTLFS